MSGEDSAKTEYVLAEYREAANAYFKGVDIGYTGVRGYITINLLFATALGVLAEPKIPTLLAAGDVGRLIPIFALLTSTGFFSAFPHYFRHLKNCQHRCQELEALWGGLLFTRLNRIAGNQIKVGGAIGAIIITVPLILFWVILAARLDSFGYILKLLGYGG